MRHPTPPAGWACPIGQHHLPRHAALTPASSIAAMPSELTPAPSHPCFRRMGLPYAGSATDWMYPFPGIPDRLAQLQREGYLLCILNNQARVVGVLIGS